MTKQEEIREGVAGIDFCWNLCGERAYECNMQATCPALLGRGKERSLRKVDHILAYLHSQGVVIKVDRDSAYCRIPIDKVPLSGNGAHVEVSELAKAGYVAVEPLIKEGK